MGEETAVRARRVALIFVVVIVIIVGVAVPAYVYNTYLAPKPAEGAPSFYYSETKTVVEGAHDLTFEFTYERVMPPWSSAKIYLNITECARDGNLELRALGSWRVEGKVGQTNVQSIDFTEDDAYNTKVLAFPEDGGAAEISMAVWGFEGTVQFIITIESGA